VAGFIGLWGNCGIIWGNELQGNARQSIEPQRSALKSNVLSIPRGVYQVSLNQNWVMNGNAKQGNEPHSSAAH
jgi:hypothetical protein